MKSIVAILILACAGAVSTLWCQVVVIDDFKTARTTTAPGPLWVGAGNIDSSGSYTICTVANNMLNCTAQPLQPGQTAGANGVAFWLNSCNGINNGCYDQPGSYMKAYSLNGTWTPKLNRLRMQYYCDSDFGKAGIEWGTYSRNLLDPNPSESGQGQHFYHGFQATVYHGQWIYVEFNDVVHHIVGDYSGMNYARDPTYFRPQDGAGSLPVHYYDGMTHWYFAGTYILNPNSHVYNGTCHFANITAASDNNAAENWVYSTAITYLPTANSGAGGYEVNWSAPKLVPGGVVYDLRYSTSSMRANGWKTGTPAGTQTSLDGSAYTNVTWVSPAMPAATNMYFALRPRMRILGVTSTSPMIVTPAVDSNLSPGDEVTIAGALQSDNVTLHPANGTWTVSQNARPVFFMSDGSLASIQVSKGGGPGGWDLGVATTTSAHGLQTGQYVLLTNPPSNAEYLASNGGPIAISQIDATHFSFPVYPNYVPYGTYDKSNAGSVVIETKDSLILTNSDGSAANGFKSWSGTMTATSDTSNFAEIVAGPAAANYSTFSRCDLNTDGTVDLIDVQSAINQSLGISPCSNANLLGTGTCNVVSVQRIITAALGGSCKTGI
jgi:hypothetical protein